jgi:hypothetical protein
VSLALVEFARLVLFGNAALSRGYDLGRATGAAIDPSAQRWKFEIRPFPLETVARSPQSWFRWLQSMHYRRLLLVPLRPPYFGIAAAGDGGPMLWDEWRRRKTGIYYTGPMTFDLRGSDADDEVTQPAVPSLSAMIERLDPMVREASALAPEDADAFDRARRLLHASHPALPARTRLLPPISYVLDVRRVAAALDALWEAGSRYNYREPSPPRPERYGATIRDAIVAAVNAA